MKFDTKKYREFNSSDEAQKWANDHYSDMINLDEDSAIYNAVTYYIGSAYMMFNRYLRDGIDIDEEDIAKVKQLVELVNSHTIPEDIVLYRVAHLKDIFHMLDKKVVLKGEFVDKGFTSTSLVLSLMDNFAKKERRNCILKIYVPKGHKGAYVSIFKRSLLNEHEILLPPNSRFEIIKVHPFTCPLLIECKVIQDD